MVQPGFFVKNPRSQAQNWHTRLSWNSEKTVR